MDIHITVSLNATTAEIMAEVNKQLARNALGEASRRWIGDPVRIIPAEITIHIVRQAGPEKVEQACACIMCGTLFVKSQGYRVWTNYGGNTRSIMLCSKTCQGATVALSPGRIALSRGKLTPVRTF